MAIRSDKDPSSAAPHSGLDTGDLEKYGVWVKAEPRDILDSAGGSTLDDLDLDLPSEASPVSEESFLSEDEERLLGTFDAEFGSSPLSEASASDLGPLPDIEDASSSLGDSGFDMSLEDLAPPSSAGSIHPDAEIDMDSVSGLDLEADLESAPRDSSGGMEDVSAEFLDDLGSGQSPALPSGPRSSDFGVDDVTSQFLAETEESIPLSHPVEASQDFESLDIDLHFEGDSGSELARDREAVSEFDDFISPSGSKQRPEGFDDIAAVTASLSDEASGGTPGRAGSSDLSSELLGKIADELRNIRGELVSLKDQIAGIAVPPDSAPRPEAPVGQEDAAGFFNKEEDETIALTGDELDNILNTADFTEEAVEPPSESLLDESLLPESGVYASDRQAAPAIEEIRLGEADSVDEIEDIASEDSLSELVSVAEEGVRSMTSAPEDASYLEGDDLHLDEGLSLDGAPFEDVPLVEPDLSEFDLEADEAEAGLEISDELPLASEQQDMALDIDAGPGYGHDYQADEAEFLEPVPESDESGFGEISLHEESKFKAPEGGSDEAIGEAGVEEVEELEELSEPAGSEAISVLPDEVPISLDESIDIDSGFDSPLSSDEVLAPAEEAVPEPAPAEAASVEDDRLKTEIRSVLSYLDKLLDSLPEEKIEEFAKSEYFDTYKRLFEELGLV